MIFQKRVPTKIKEYLDKGHKRKVEIKEIDYKGTCFSKATHRLAFAELQEIVKYQDRRQCLFQTPEGVGTFEEKFWEENYRIKG